MDTNFVISVRIGGLNPMSFSQGISAALSFPRVGRVGTSSDMKPTAPSRAVIRVAPTHARTKKRHGAMSIATTH